MACDLSSDPKLHTNLMKGVGPIGAELLFVGHGPGEEDDNSGIPYSGRTGVLFRELLAEAGINEHEIYITNATKCASHDISLTDKHFKACRGYLLREINRIRPKAIVSIGAKALEWLTGLTGVANLRKHGLPCLLSDDLLVFPLPQPAVLFHKNGKAKTTARQEFVEDLMWLKNKARQGKLKESDTVPTDYKMAESIQDVQDFVAELMEADELSVDLETTSLYTDPDEVIVAIGFSPRPGVSRAIPMYCWGLNTYHFWTDEQMEQVIIPSIRKLLLSKKVYGQNFLQFDQKWLKKFFDIDECKVVFDTMIAHYLTDETKGTHKLEQLALKYTTMNPWKKSFTIKEIKKCCTYLCKDTDATCRVKQQLETQLTDRQNWLLQTLLIPLGHELKRMEYGGVFVNQEALGKLSVELDSKLSFHKQAISSMPEVKAFELDENTTLNSESPKHLAIVMEKYLHLKKMKSTGKGEYSTDSEVLGIYKNEPFIQHVQSIRRLAKLRGTYCEGMKDCIRSDGRIHTNFLICGTETGRLSSQNPNLMNIPREDTSGKSLDDAKLLKSIFGAPVGYSLIQADLSQAELRTTAAYSKDEALTDIYRRGEDAHTSTAARVFEIDLSEVTKPQRTLAKAINFGVIYGKTEQGLIEFFIQQGSTRDEASSFYNSHRKTFPGLWRFMDGLEQIILDRGYLESYFGRRRRFDSEELTKHNIREAMNFLPQSTASDFCFFILVRSSRLLRRLGIDAYPVLTVYDSVVYVVKDDQKQDALDTIKTVVDNLGFEDFLGDIKMEADYEIGHDWGHMEEIILD